MAIVVLHPSCESKFLKKQVEIIKIDGKYYIELDEFENSDCIVELSIALAQENESLKERIRLLEGCLDLRQQETTEAKIS